MDTLWQILKRADFKISTDTRADMSGTVYFALKGANFDGNNFAHQALEKGALIAVTDNPEINGKNIYLVTDVLKTLQTLASRYRKTFRIPIVAIGGSNGKTTSKDLIRDVLKKKYKVHATESSLNNHLGVPLSILAMPQDTEIGIFEIGANHPGEHLHLLDIILPTHVTVTNNGMDHLEGFGSPEGARLANKEIYDWARAHSVETFVNKNHLDLVEDSESLERTLYPEKILHYVTKLIGEYNKENMDLAFAIGQYFKVSETDALQAIADYEPLSKRSQSITKNGIHFIVDCYNANPTSMMLALESFVQSIKSPHGVILGDMLELGDYAKAEHKKIVDFILTQNLETAIFVGEHFKKALENNVGKYEWFADSNQAREWFQKQDWKSYTLLLKASRGIRLEKVIE